MAAAFTYPTFVDETSKSVFFHWYYKRTTLKTVLDMCMYGSCSYCNCFAEIVKNGTKHLLKIIFESYDSFSKGSNVVAIYGGKMSRQKARHIMKTCKKLPKGDVFESVRRMNGQLDEDFPALYWTLPEHLEGCHVYAPMMGRGSNSLYHVLSLLYKSCMDETCDTTLKWHSVIDHVLLCFHLSQRYLLSSNTVLEMWTTPLQLDRNTTLLYDDGGETETAFHKLLSELNEALKKESSSSSSS